MKKYIDNNGLLYFWGKIKTYVANAITGKADNLTYTGDKLTLKSGATTLSEVTITAGTTDYLALNNKPTINNVQLTGNKSLTDLGIDIPTKVSKLMNDSNYQTDTQVTNAITSAIAGVTQFDYQVVAQLPATGKKGIIYLVNQANSSGQNIYLEYIWITNKYEQLGDKEVDLTGYTKDVDLVAITNGEIDTITA